MLNPTRDKNDGTYRGGGTTSVTTACPEDRRGVKTSCYELSWKVKVMIKKKEKKRKRGISGLLHNTTPKKESAKVTNRRTWR